MHPAPIVMADRTRKKSAKHNLNIIIAPCLVSIAYWRRGTSVLLLSRCLFLSEQLVLERKEYPWCYDQMDAAPVITESGIRLGASLHYVIMSAI